ncbi:MAG: hypothetical protein AB1297_02465 [bacterium]
MKRIFLGLMITGVVFGQPDHRLSMNGNLGFGVRYIDINKDVDEYPKDFSYTVELSGVGKLDKNDVGGILNFSYDKLNKTDVQNAYLSLDLPSGKLEGGDVLLDISDFTIKNSTIRGVKGDFEDKGVLFAYGVSKEKKEQGSTTSGQYRQWLGIARVSSVFRDNTWGITYIQAEDDPASVALSNTKPIINKVFEGDIVIPLSRALSFKSNLAFSEYDKDKSNREELYKNKAFLSGFSLNFSKFFFEGIYQYIEPNFYTAGNIGCDVNWEGIKLNTKYIPSDKPVEFNVNIESYDDNPSDREVNTTKTRIYEIKSEITPRQFPEVSIDYKNTKEKDNTISPLRIANEFSFGISCGIKDIDTSFNYSRSSSDNKKDNEYDSLLSSYSLNASGPLTKKVSFSSSISFITSEAGAGAQKTEQDSNFYLLSASFQPTQSLRITPSYDYSKTKEKTGTILEENITSFSFAYSLSVKYQINMEYKNIDHKEKDNDYRGDSMGIKMSCLF